MKSNAVLTRVKEVDWVGFEPTTSAALLGCSLLPSHHFLSSIIVSEILWFTLAEKSLVLTRSQRYGTRRGILEGKPIGFTIRQLFQFNT
jgi:hypothetical protein